MSQRSRSRKKTGRLFRRAIKKALERREALTVSQWAEQYRVLDDASNLSGRWSNSVTPYLMEIMDTMNDPDIRRVFLCKASQIGGTSALINMLCYVITQSPAPSMIVYPNDDLAKDVSNDKLKPAFRMIPEVRKLFQENSSKELRMKFKTMVLYLRGSGSAAKLVSKEIKYLFFDEIDKMGGASKKEASPFNLALERTKTYKPQEKVFACSTPTLKTNYIWNLHEGADEVRHYFVRCPSCGAMVELKFSQILFDKDEGKKLSNYERAQTAVYACQECGCEISDGDKPKALREGRWKAVKKRGVGSPKTVGYWISSLYSLFLKWSDVVEEFLDSKDDPELLQNFVNSWLAEPWEDTKLKTSEELVMERQTEVPELVVPCWAKLLTGGVDVQETCVYWTIRAWGDFVTSQNIAHGQAFSLDEAGEIMNLQYEVEGGGLMVVNLCLIDSGYDTDNVYDFCALNSEWALPVKGSSNPMQNHFTLSKVNKDSLKAYGMNLVIVDGGKYKDMIAGRMRRPNGKGSWMVHKGCDREYAKQVTAEHKVTVRNGGKARQEWVKKANHADNHYLDAEVYALAAADTLGVRMLHLQANHLDEGKHDNPQEQHEESWIRQEDRWI